MLTQVFADGDPVPPGGAAFDTFSLMSLNELGQLSVRAGLDFFGTDHGVFRGDGVNQTTIARTGGAAPGGSTYRFVGGPSLNDSGVIAFQGFLQAAGAEGVFRGDGATSVAIARNGLSAPGGNGTFFQFEGARINNLGQVAFSARLTGTSGGANDDVALYRGDGVTTTQILREGQAAPGGNGIFTTSGALLADRLQLNNLGQVAFSAVLANTSGGTNDDFGLFRTDGTTLVTIAREGQAAPVGGGTFNEPGIPVLNHLGQVAFNTGFKSSSEFAIYRGDGTTLTQVARTGGALPEGNGTIATVFTPHMNDLGQVAFRASLAGTSGGSDDNIGLYFFDDALGLQTIARTGEPRLGSTITSLFTSSVNDLGDVGYYFELADGRNGIAVWSVPEPASLGMSVAAGSLLLRRRHR